MSAGPPWDSIPPGPEPPDPQHPWSRPALPGEPRKPLDGTEADPARGTGSVTYGTAYMAPPGRPRYRTRAAAWLRRVRHPRGGWPRGWVQAGYTEDTPLDAAMADPAAPGTWTADGPVTPGEVAAAMEQVARGELPDGWTFKLAPHVGHGQDWPGDG
jgi:hypothetical protein